METIKLNDNFFTGIEIRPKASILNDLNKYRIDLSKEIEKPPICLKMIQDNKEIPFCTLGNFSLIIGKAKSKKTFFVSLLIASMLSDEFFMNSFINDLPSNQKKVVLFDTEQSEYHVQKVARRIPRLLKQDYLPNFEAYYLRTATTSERLQLIEEYIYSRDDIGFLVIDGIRDLITAINDETESNIIKDKLLKWTDERKIHIVVVLHQNKNDSNARGHIGSELVNKAETVISITKDTQNKDVSIVESEYSRDIDFEPFAFEINEFSLPQIQTDWIKSKGEKKKSIIPDTINLDKHRSVLATVFCSSDKLSYANFCIEIKTAFAGLEIEFGDNKAKQFATYYKQNKFVICEGKGNKTMYKLTPAINYDLEV